MVRMTAVWGYAPEGLACGSKWGSNVGPKSKWGAFESMVRTPEQYDVVLNHEKLFLASVSSAVNVPHQVVTHHEVLLLVK